MLSKLRSALLGPPRELDGKYIFTFEFNNEKYIVIYVNFHGKIITTEKHLRELMIGYLDSHPGLSRSYIDYVDPVTKRYLTLYNYPKLIDMADYPNIQRVIKVNQSQIGDISVTDVYREAGMKIKRRISRLISNKNKLNDTSELTVDDIKNIFLEDERDKYMNPIDKGLNQLGIKTRINVSMTGPKYKKEILLDAAKLKTENRTSTAEFVRDLIERQQGFYNKKYTFDEKNRVDRSMLMHLFYRELFDFGFSIKRDYRNVLGIKLSEIFEDINENRLGVMSADGTERKITGIKNVIIIDTSCNVPGVKIYSAPGVLYHPASAAAGGGRNKTVIIKRNKSKRKTIKKQKPIHK